MGQGNIRGSNHVRDILTQFVIKIWFLQKANVRCHNSRILIVQQPYGQNKLASKVVVIKRKKKSSDQSRIFNVICNTNSGRVLDRIKKEDAAARQRERLLFLELQCN